ncbi:MAG: glycosyltransferase family 2 protein [Rikenellaceae bacterium]
MVAIIILNWNGWQDTLACLDSLYKQQGSDFFIVVVDNNSQDQSVKEISEWLLINNKSYQNLTEGQLISKPISKYDCILYSLDENYGFAKGNNLAMELIKKVDVDYYLLLNNDTVATELFLATLIDFSQHHKEYRALTPQIRYHKEPDIIWNCGGHLFAGFRKYHYAKYHKSTLPQKSHIPISFITGCALFITKELHTVDKLFTEKFFFGEEDFEFSLRQRHNRVKMACVLDSILYHKVSATQTKDTQLGRIFIHYLNRFINVRDHYCRFYVYFWVKVNLIYINRVVLRHLPKNKRVEFIKLLALEYSRKTTVDRDTFFHYSKLFSK